MNTNKTLTLSYQFPLENTKTHLNRAHFTKRSFDLINLLLLINTYRYIKKKCCTYIHTYIHYNKIIIVSSINLLLLINSRESSRRFLLW